DEDTSTAGLFGSGVIYEQPSVVFVFAIVLFDRGLLALAGDANDRAAGASTAAAQARTRPLGIEGARLAGWCAKALPASAGRTRPAARTRAATKPRITGGTQATRISRRGWRSGKTGLSLVLQLDLSLADVDEPPLAILGHGIFVTLAQETQV